ncbi:MAG: Na/Pi cotransporter family protein, partial [Planctomycetes bacterium]|nr:Na/Pi cotransporter family protein [Planctomycetota bacterium]
HGTSTSPVRVITGPVVDGVKWLVGQVFSNPAWVGTLVAVLGLLMLFFSLFLMVTNLRGALLHRLEGLFRSIFFRNDLFAGVAGVVTTVLVQSSSITTSLIVPLAGAGAVTLNRVFPFMLGANIGTTCTGVIVALAVVDDPASVVNEKGIAVTVAASHVLFNLIGILIWYPLKIVPLGLARWYGRLAARSKRYAFLFLLVVFVVIPVIGITITELLRAP